MLNAAACTISDAFLQGEMLRMRSLGALCASISGPTFPHRSFDAHFGQRVREDT